MNGAPTSFGPISYSLDSGVRSLARTYRSRAGRRCGSLSLRLRRPGGERITRVELDRRAFRRFDPAAETIDLTGHTGSVTLTVHFAAS